MNKCAKIKIYESLNYNMYPHTVFEPRYFAAPDDIPMEGSREQRRRIGKINYRRRRARMIKEIERRIQYLLQPQEFEPIFDFKE